MKQLLAFILLCLATAAQAQQPSWTTPGPSTGTGYPTGAIPVMVSAAGTTGVVTATIPAIVARTTYLCGITISATATTAINGTATITGTLGGTISYLQGVGATPAIVTFDTDFIPCIPASAPNTAIVVNSIAAGIAGVTTVVAQGYQF